MNDMDALKDAARPLVYSCSGCSSAAQMANGIALKLDQHGRAEMSCIAGVGGGVKKLVHLAKSGRTLIAIDGCPLACCRACLANHGLRPDLHFELSEYGVSKKRGQDYNVAQMEGVLEEIAEVIQRSFTAVNKSGAPEKVIHQGEIKTEHVRQ